MTKRLKIVLKDASQVNHVWAQQSQEYGHTPERFPRYGGGYKQSSQSFSGTTLYSYGTPIANFVKNKKGKSACLITTEKYSVTTSANMPCKSDIPPGVAIFRVKHIGVYSGCAPYPSSDFHKDNIEDMARRYAESAKLYSRASVIYRAEGYLVDCRVLKENARDYAKFFCIRFRPSLFPEISQELRDKMNARCEKNRVAKEARELAAKKNRREAVLRRVSAFLASDGALNNVDRDFADFCDAETAARVREKAIALWRANKVRVIAWQSYEPEDTLLRVSGDEIETSRGASFPLAHGVKAWPAIKSCHDAGREFVTNGHQIHLGHFKIDRIDADGTVRAGCHVVSYGEIARVAQQLGLEG